MTDDTDAVIYNLVLPFDPVASCNGDYDDRSYAAGWEMGALAATLENGRPAYLRQMIHTTNVRQADLIAMKYGYDTVAVTITGTWANVALRETVTG